MAAERQQKARGPRRPTRHIAHCASLPWPWSLAKSTLNPYLIDNIVAIVRTMSAQLYKVCRFARVAVATLCGNVGARSVHVGFSAGGVLGRADALKITTVPSQDPVEINRQDRLPKGLSYHRNPTHWIPTVRSRGPSRSTSMTDCH
eukprot:scaffold5085_cov81-Isochrysis_galbana.AAC.1